MNDIEKLLGQLSLKKPSPELDERVQQALQPAAPESASATRRSPPRPSWLALVSTAAACLLVGVLIGQVSSAKPPLPEPREVSRDEPETQSEVPEQGLAPKAASRDASTFQAAASRDSSKSANASATVVEAESLVLLNGKSPMRTYRATTVKRVKVYDERTGKLVEMSVPVRRVFMTNSIGS